MRIEFEQWFEKYQPVKNKLHPDRPYNGYMFDTDKDDITYLINSQTPNHQLWTLVDCDNEEQYIIPGWHIVNRAGYFMTRLPWLDETIEVDLNEYVTVGAAKYAAIEFMESLGIDEALYEDKIHDFFSSRF